MYLLDDSVMLKLTQEERAKGLLSLSLADFKGLRQVKDLSRQRTSLLFCLECISSYA